MTNDVAEAANRFKPCDQQPENMGHAASKRIKEAAVQLRQGTTLQEQISKIEHGFDVNQRPPLNPSNKNLTVSEVLDVLPDMAFFKNQYVQVIFDTEPISAFDVGKAKKKGDQIIKSDEHRMELMKKAIIRITNSENDKSDAPLADDLLDYFVPDDRPLSERKRKADQMDVDDAAEELTWLREYVHGIGTSAESHKLGSTFLFSRRENGKMLYTPLSLQYNLKKMKATGRKESKKSKKFSLVKLESRDPTEGEKKAMAAKEAVFEV
jgi:hypothetical protein